MPNTEPALLGFAAYSGTGKTTLMEKLLPMLREQGLAVAVVKHAHHDFDIDYPGKDSFRLRKAGAVETLVASKYRWALVHEKQHEQEFDPEKIDQEPDLFELLNHLKHHELDLILVEGFKHEAIPRLEIHREHLNNNYLYPGDEHIIAIATDSTHKKITYHNNLEVLDLNNSVQILNFILKFVRDTLHP